MAGKGSSNHLLKVACRDCFHKLLSGRDHVRISCSARDPMASWRAFLLMMSLLASEPALADMKDAWDAYDHGEYDKAAELFRAEADHGDSEAQYMMGQLYGEGHLGPRDFASAARWYEKAAQQGHPDAE